MFNLFKPQPKGKRLTFKIEGMHCTSCAMTIDGALEDMDGVLQCNTSYAKSKVEIEFDDTKVTPQELIKSIELQGYTAVTV